MIGPGFAAAAFARDISIIIGVCVSLGVLIGLGVAAAVWWLA